MEILLAGTAYIGLGKEVCFHTRSQQGCWGHVYACACQNLSWVIFWLAEFNWAATNPLLLWPSSGIEANNGVCYIMPCNASNAAGEGAGNQL